jgi:flagellar biosynthesis/type III secretory pathway protein FliH
LNKSNPVASALMAKMDIAPKDRPKVKAECLRLLATLKLNPAKMQLISGFVDTYLRLNRTEEIEFQQEISSFTQPIKEEVMQITTSWMERGIEQGIERGIEQGVEREKAFILRQLKRKLGKLNQQLEADIIKLNIDDIEALGEALLDFNTVEDLTNWLNSFVS